MLPSAILLIFIVIGILIFYHYCLWKIFERSGHPGWAATVPIYNLIVMCRIAKKPGWWAALMCIPYLGLIWTIWTLNRMAKGFGKSGGFTIGLIFLGFIFLPIWAFDDSEYDSSRLD